MSETYSSYYLIHVDILGYKSFIEEISYDTGIEEREIRRNFRTIIDEKISELIKNEIILSGSVPNRDDWTLITNRIDNVILTVSTLFDHYTQYTHFRNIPLEIAIGKGHYDKWAKINCDELFFEKDTVKVYSENLLSAYHKYFHTQYGENSKLSSFIVLTNDTYEDLSSVEKEYCALIESINKSGEKVSVYAPDLTKFATRGKYLSFLNEIGHAEDNKVRRVDSLYVAPNEYDEMLYSLKLHRILFITGTQEYGKTFSAIKFLWEFYKDGYEPNWISGSEESDRKEGRKKIEYFSSIIKPKTITYFEDPFGKTVYERRESLERNIGVILEAINNIRDAFVIITSREEVFKEFKQKKISANELEKFEKRLNVKSQSYDYPARQKMLMNWAKEYNCVWKCDKKSIKMILNLMLYQNQLPTPLNIHDFALTSHNISNNELLETLVFTKSGETAKAFASEIETMSFDKQVFLSFPLIGEFEIDFIKNSYDRIIEKKNEAAQSNYISFNSLISWFDKDKISIYSSWQGKKIRFSHPSYAESLKYLLLDENRERTKINLEIITPIVLDILKNTNKNWIISQVFNTIFQNFEAFPIDCQNQIFLSAKRTSHKDILLNSLIENFSLVPEKCKDILFNMLKDDYTAKKIISFIIKEYPSLSFKYRQILFHLSEKSNYQDLIAQIIFTYFDQRNPPISEDCVILWRKIKKIRPLSEYGIN